MQTLRERICRIAPSDAAVLILGETGTGKELVAEAIAALSGLRPVIAANCAAYSPGTIESELFGHERGAFTGAVRKHTGVIARANGGILFLDEVGEIPYPVQVKLLRTLESGEYEPVGSTVQCRSLFRLLAATNADPERMVARGTLRPDFLYRLDVVRICVPPLRDRLEDIPLLTEEFRRRYVERCGWGPSRVSPEACTVLMQHGWPGNVRQLRNVVEASAAVAGRARAIDMVHVLEFLVSRGSEGVADELPTLAEARTRAEQHAILVALRRSGGNRELAANLLRISVATLYRKLGKRSPQTTPS